MSVSDFLSMMGDFIAQLMIWVQGVWAWLISPDNVILVLLILGVPLCGIGIGFLQRLFKLSR